MTSRTDTASAAEPITRRERKKRETRRRIYRAAFDLFREKGFDETTVEEIAERADVGKGTVFNHFPRKSSFLLALFEDWVSRITEEMGPVEEWQGTTRTKLEQLFFFLANLSGESPELFRKAFFEHLRSIPERDGCMQPHHPAHELATMIRAVLGQGQAAGEVRTNLNPVYAASLVESVVFKTLAFWIMAGGSFDDVSSEMSAKLDIVFEGLAPRE